MDLRDKVAVVTGAAHRLGRDIALELAGAGAHIVVHYFQAQAQAGATVDDVRQHGVRAVAVQADLARPEEAARLFQAARAEFGGVDVLINSAAIMQAANALDLPPQAWQHTLDVNLSGPFYCAQQAARSMLERGQGAIVNIADVAGLEPWAGYPAHSVSKAGLIMLTGVLAKALAPAIRVNAVAPGPVVKPDDWDEDRWRRLGRRTLLKRAGSGYDVARAVLFLVQQDFITGETLVVDGGYRHA